MDQYNNQQNQLGQGRQRALTLWNDAQFTSVNTNGDCQRRNEGNYSGNRYYLDSKNNVYIVDKDLLTVYFVGGLNKTSYVSPTGYYMPQNGKDGNNTLSSLKLEKNYGRTTLVQFLKTNGQTQVFKYIKACMD
jgi:hypothetical protein